MSTNEQIYGLRKQIGSRRQSVFEPIVLQLDGVLERHRVSNPYDAGRNAIDELLKIGAFANGCSGSNARVHTGPYLYHLSTVAKLKQLTWVQPDFTGDD